MCVLPEDHVLLTIHAIVPLDTTALDVKTMIVTEFPKLAVLSVPHMDYVPVQTHVNAVLDTTDRIVMLSSASMCSVTAVVYVEEMVNAQQVALVYVMLDGLVRIVTSQVVLDWYHSVLMCVLAREDVLNWILVHVCRDTVVLDVKVRLEVLLQESTMQKATTCSCI